MNQADEAMLKINADFGFKLHPETFIAWNRRPPARMCPASIIIDTDRNNIFEIYDAHYQNHYCREIQFLVPNLDWLKDLYTMVEARRHADEETRSAIYKHMDTTMRLTTKEGR